MYNNTMNQVVNLLTGCSRWTPRRSASDLPDSRRSAWPSKTTSSWRRLARRWPPQATTWKRPGLASASPSSPWRASSTEVEQVEATLYAGRVQVEGAPGSAGRPCGPETALRGPGGRPADGDARSRFASNRRGRRPPDGWSRSKPAPGAENQGLLEERTALLRSAETLEAESQAVRVGIEASILEPCTSSCANTARAWRWPRSPRTPARPAARR